MKFCPKCNARYGYEMSFCLEDGTPLQIQSSNDDENAVKAPHPAIEAEKFSENPLMIPRNSLPNTNISSENISDETIILANPPRRVLPPEKNEPPKSKTGFLIGLAVAGFLLIAATISGVVYFQNRPSKEFAANSLSTNAANSPQANNSNGDANGTASQIASKDSAANKSNSIPAEKTNSRTTVLAKKTPEAALSISGQTQKVETDNPEPLKTATLPPDPVKPTPQLNFATSVSGGIPNRKTVSLIKPSYPPAAKAVRASGRVDVQVTIDESGEVVAAYAISGHPSLRLSAEQAARASKFSPTTTKGNTTGNIVYNFTPQ